MLSERASKMMSGYLALQPLPEISLEDKPKQLLPKRKQLKKYERKFAEKADLKAFVMSDNYFLKKLTTRLNDSPPPTKHR